MNPKPTTGFIQTVCTCGKAICLSTAQKDAYGVYRCDECLKPKLTCRKCGVGNDDAVLYHCDEGWICEACYRNRSSNARTSQQPTATTGPTRDAKEAE